MSSEEQRLRLELARYYFTTPEYREAEQRLVEFKRSHRHD